jgi:pyruvate/2-oxoglutarate dehydrogenase complex dihydrolipoamide dehydrogenase (E3) component
MPTYDLVILGGGAGGLVAASGAAQLGARVALVEKERALGGDCLHYGCVPTKTLVRTAKVRDLMRRAPEFGLPRPDNLRVEFAAVMEHMRAVIARVGEHDDPGRFEAMGVAIYWGAGRFLNPHELEAGGERIRGRRFVIATGSRPVIPRIPGLEEAEPLTNISALQLNHQPQSLAILGAGPIGMEFAQVFHRLGTQVTVIEKLGQILPREDAEVAGVLQALLEREGIGIHTCTEVKEVRRVHGRKALIAQCPTGEKTFEAEAILTAVGRAPNIEGLQLEAAGVAYTKQGIVVDSTLRTSAHDIYACGDVTGLYPFTHMAEYQAGIIVANALFPFFRRKADYRVVPWVTFTDPELGRVGLTEEEARKAHGDVKVYRLPFRDVDRAVAEGEAEGLIKLICDRKLRIVGAHVLGPGGGDLLHEYVLAMRAGLPLTRLSTTIHAYPTLAQAVKRTADQYYREKLFTGWFPRFSRRVIAFTRWMGL